MPLSLHDHAVEHLGTQIVSGAYPSGHVMLAEQLARELNVSRSVVREATRVLASLGLIETVRRLGIRVLPAAHWNPFDPMVIRWRLAGTGRGAQLRSLAELRTAVEPAAAELAAQFAPPERRRELFDVALAMKESGQSGDVDVFLALDIRFHSLLLTGSGNEMFATMVGQVAETLTGRTVAGLMPDRPTDAPLQWHIEMAQAILVGNGHLAREASEKIMRRSLSEMSQAWQGQPRSFRPVPALA
ncbi:FCD domain-containing protein [Pseudarthrobacter sp. PS3-L1]|uniref:FadR/GntR family transcriptional regulator n=1 Tax=Pseudarthrobacter sp. PS3-L1 TaxID=3046207 RepID=UPI0024BB5715|nr:FCD domain-containing protein [Pseudarthrobacter sp. PS3-L1]MDJ0321806.1 FCD domain-containing protein [Pseudarthrobacter sp. PS3-L1]